MSIANRILQHIRVKDPHLRGCFFGLLSLITVFGANSIAIANTVYAPAEAVFYTKEHDTALVIQEFQFRLAEVADISLTTEEGCYWFYLENHKRENPRERNLWIAVQFRETALGLQIQANLLNSDAEALSKESESWRTSYRQMERAILSLNKSARDNQVISALETRGFAEFDFLISRLEKSLKSPVPSLYTLADYPSKGRTFAKSFDSNGLLSLLLKEDSMYKQYPEIILIYVRTGFEWNSKANLWIDRIEQIITRNSKHRFLDLLTQAEDTTLRYEDFIMEISTQDSYKVLTVYETHEITAWKRKRNNPQ